MSYQLFSSLEATAAYLLRLKKQGIKPCFELKPYLYSDSLECSSADGLFLHNSRVINLKSNQTA